MYGFPWMLSTHPSGSNHESPYFPKISEYIRTLFPNTESHIGTIGEAPEVSRGPIRNLLGMGGGPYRGFIRGTRGERGLYMAPEVRTEVWVEVHMPYNL